MGIPLRALLVEDSEDDAFLLLRELQRGGFNVIHERVDTAKDMLAALNAQFWDIVFADYSMPHFNGLEALALLQQHQRPEPLILISGTIGEEVAVEAMKAGAQDYLLKDNLTRLIPAIQRTLRETQEHRARQQAEMALKASEERFHRFAENAQDILYIYRVAEPRGLEYISPAIYHITGYTPEEFYKDPDLGAQIAHPEDLELLAKIPQNDSSNSELRLRYIHKEGRAIWIEHRNVLITDEAGRLIAVEGIARDITERIAAERALIASEEKFRQLAENLREVFWIHELDGDKTIYVSPAYEEIWGRTRQSLYQDGASFLEGVHPDDKARVTAAYQRSRQNGIFDEEYRILHPNGSVRWLWGRTFPITNEAGQIVRIAGIAEEITQRKQHERELEAIAAVSTAIRKAANLNELVPNVLDQLQSLTSSENALLAIHDAAYEECNVMCARGDWEDMNGLRLPAALCQPHRNIHTG
ncbi:MAG: PAS domain-containing protein, partial [Chloroflexi bacterium]|nr:PAS domain-containing protein [Chloroflexota bacterium]